MAKAPVLPKNGNIQIKLYDPHKGQKRLHRSKARFRVAPCGRRFGKTLGAINEELEFLLNHRYTNGLWVAPIYRQCKVVYRLVKRALKEVIVSWSDTELRLEFVNDSILEFYSDVNPDAMRGNKYHFVVIDECADVQEETWTKVIRPMLSDTNGRVLFIGTPKGRNWFYRIFEKGNDPLEPEWESFTFPTSENPYIPASEIEAARKDLPQDVFEQEYLAVFHEESAGVFRGIDRCILGELEECEEILDGSFYIHHAPVKGQMYTMGWDVAKYQDFSVMTVMNAHTMHVDAWFRTNMVDYTEQIKRAKILSTLYNNAYVLMDSTGVGDPVLEMLKKAEVAADGYLFTNASKKLLIEESQVGIEHRAMTFPRLPKMLAELRTMQYKMSPSRLIQYEAPKGYHDDCVFSLALAYHAAYQGGQEIPIAAVQGEADEDDRYEVQDYHNEALYERQMRVAQLLGGVNLVARLGE